MDDSFKFWEVALYLEAHEHEPMFATIAKLQAMGYTKHQIREGFRYWLSLHRP